MGLRSGWTGIDRRSLLGGAGALLVAGPALVGRAAGEPATWAEGDPFRLGVAAGSPAPDGFVLWTRLAPDPLSADPERPGGMAPEAATVTYEIAADPQMRVVVRRGSALADPAFAHAVHLEVRGLEPGRPYWYRFVSGEAASRVGLARTLPSPGARLGGLKLGFVSCSHYEQGYFAAYRHLADDAPDFVLFLGDYIYEGVEQRGNPVRRHSDGVEATTLPLYRNRYAQYRLDPDLQRLHAEVPALVTWDDHEVENDYADRWSPSFEDPDKFLLRRAAAYQAYFEHMPLRPSLAPRGPSLRLHDRYSFGDLVEIAMLDGRQYRSREACYGPPNKGGGHLETNESCPERLDPSRSLLGFEQEAWLQEGLSRSGARWNVLGQDVLMAQLGQNPMPGINGFWTDSWDGYPAARGRLMRYLHEARIRNPVVLSGDIHSFWANDLRLSEDDPGSTVVATEFVGTSVTSRPPPYDVMAKEVARNPHVRYFESRARGYSTVEVAPDVMRVRFRGLSNHRDPNATAGTLKTFIVEDGRPGAQDG